MARVDAIKKQSLWTRIWKYRYIYLLLLPGLVYFIIFKYIPIYGIQLAFKDFSFAFGISGSPWVGFDNFDYLFSEAQFWNAFKNTLIISFMKLIFAFPIPVLLAIFLSEIRWKKYRRVVQTVLTFPHFLSWVVLSGIMFTFLSNTGVVNNMLEMAGLERVEFLTNAKGFRWLLVLSDIWKESGWSTIIYLAAILGVDVSLNEAANIDGATRLEKIRYIVWPEIRSVVIVMFILQVGSVMEAGFMQVLNLYNSSVYSVGDILDTYVYRITFQTGADFGISTAVSLFKGITNCILLLTANFVAKRFGEKGIS